MTAPSRQQPAPRQPTAAPPVTAPRTRLWVLCAGLATVLIAVLAVAWWLLLGSTAPPAEPVVAGPTPEMPRAAAVAPAAAKQPHPPPKEPPVETPTIVDDDGKSLWVSPTDGKPLDLGYLAPGAQIILALRPAELLKQGESAKIRAALGPLGQEAIQTVERMTTIPLADIEQLLVGCQISSSGEWSVTYVVHAAKPISRESLVAKLPNIERKDRDGKKYALSNSAAYYLPSGTADKVLVVAPEDTISDVIDLAGQSPPLRRDIERLIAHTDAERQVTILFAPNSLFAEGHLFSDEASRLRDPLFWFLGDELSGAALSLNWDANFFLELVASPTLDTPPEKAARIFAKRVTEIPNKLEAYLATLEPQQYSQEIIARFPAMVRRLAKYTRTRLDSDRFSLRCYLPAAAGHNLLLAAELTLAEPPGKAASPPSATVAVSNASSSVQERLAKVTSLKFAKDTLESALDQLSQDIGAPIVIRGPDLQADGITKNQSFGIDLSNKPAEEILVEILHLANPDKTSPGPHDARQKLVYVIQKKPDKTEQIVVTTRAKAKERHDELPAAFRPAKP